MLEDSPLLVLLLGGGERAGMLLLRLSDLDPAFSFDC